MSSADLFEDGFPHGTKEGYERGCRGHGSCPGVLDFGRSCNQASMHYSGDYTYRQRVDAGLTPAEIRELELADVTAAKPVKRVSGSGTNLSPGLNEAPPYAEPTVTVESNRTPIRAEDFADPEPVAAADGILLERHGTRFGYNDGCRLKEACPGVERIGVSCTQAVSAYQLERKRARKAEAGQVATVPEAAEGQPEPAASEQVSSEPLAGVETGTRVRAEDLLTELADTKDALERALADVAALREELVQAGLALDVEKAKTRDLVVAEARAVEQLEPVGATPPGHAVGLQVRQLGDAFAFDLSGGGEGVRLELSFDQGQLQHAAVTTGA